MFPKRKPIRSQAIRESADGEACTICGKQDGTVVFCHLNHGWAGKGAALKADDIAGFFGCKDCHDKYDGRVFPRIFNEDYQIMRAMYRTWRRLIEKDIIKIKDFECDSRQG